MHIASASSSSMSACLGRVVFIFCIFAPSKQNTMSQGKSTCKVLKEVRRKIADANGILLEERECTHKGDCAGTCPYCESEVRYLERELSKRKSLGKAVAVAGIAMAAVTMAGCATSEPVSTNSDNASKTSIESLLSDNEFGNDSSEVVIGMVDDDFSLLNRLQKEEPMPKSIEGYEDASFPEEYGTPASWLRSKLPEFNTYIQQPRMDEVKIRFFVETDGRVSSVMIVDYKDEVGMADGNFLDAVNKAMLSMPHWNPASIKGKPVSALMTINVRDLR